MVTFQFMPVRKPYKKTEQLLLLSVWSVVYEESLGCFSQGLQAVCIGNFTLTKKTKIDSGHMQPSLQEVERCKR